MNRMGRITAVLAGTALFAAGVLTANLLGSSAHAQGNGPVSAAVTLLGFGKAVPVPRQRPECHHPGVPR